MITPAQYAAFITQTNTIIGQIYSEISPGETRRMWSSDESMQGSIWETAWSGKMPKARPWYGSRVVHEPTLQTYSVTPVPYELTVGIDQFKFDDSAVNGQSPYWRLLPDVAAQWRKQPEYELRDLLEGTGIQGTTARQAGPDGLSAFNTAHPIDFYNPGFNFGGLFTAGTYCNDFASGGQTIGGTLIGGALSATALLSMLAYMKMIPGEDGEVLGITPNMLMVPPTLEFEVNFVLKAAFYAPPSWGAFSPQSSQVGAADNMVARMGVSPIINPFLRNTKNWYLMDTTHNLKPLLWITRNAPVQVPRLNPADPIVFDSHRYTWGGWDRVAAAWGFNWLIARSGP
jgi:phage major head subunit gpT-like protein